MRKLAGLFWLVAACGDGRSDPRTRASALEEADSPAAEAPAAEALPDEPLEDPAAACGDVAATLAEMQTLVDEAEAIPADPALHLLAARLSVARRGLAVAQHELAILDAEAAAPDYVLEPARYRELRAVDRVRVEGELETQLADEAALRAQAATSIHPAVADDDGPHAVLSSIRWRAVAPQVRAYREACAGDPSALDPVALRDFVSGLALLEHDGHDVATRALEQRLLDGDDLAAELADHAAHPDVLP